MISSISIKKTGSSTVTKIAGNPHLTIEGVSGLSVAAGGDNKIVVRADNSHLLENPYNKLYSDILSGNTQLPYVTKISGVPADINNMVWLLGGKTSQVDRSKDGYQTPSEDGYAPAGDNVIYISDMGQTVDYPRIYRAVYDMLRQIRLWLDAHKDTVLLDSDNANIWWDVLKNDPDDSDPVPKSPYDGAGEIVLKSFKEPRDRSEIAAIGDSTNILGNYGAMVALWNYIVNQPLSDVSSRIHPADPAGIYIGINTHIPRLDTNKIVRRFDITINLDTDQVNAENSSDFRLWVRVPVVSCIPDNGDVTFSDVVIPSSTVVPGGGSSVLDDGIHILWTNSFTISYTVTIAEAEDAISNIYTAKNIVEVIPYMVCPYDGEDDGLTNGLYSTSRKSPRVSEQGSCSWSIYCTIFDESGNSISSIPMITKNTSYVQVCDVSDVSE